MNESIPEAEPKPNITEGAELKERFTNRTYDRLKVMMRHPVIQDAIMGGLYTYRMEWDAGRKSNEYGNFESGQEDETLKKIVKNLPVGNMRQLDAYITNSLMDLEVLRNSAKDDPSAEVPDMTKIMQDKADNIRKIIFSPLGT